LLPFSTLKNFREDLVQSAPVCLATGITIAIAGASLTSCSASTAITKINAN